MVVLHWPKLFEGQVWANHRYGNGNGFGDGFGFGDGYGDGDGGGGK